MDRKAPPVKQAEITINTLFDLSHERECEVADIFDVLTPNEVIQLLRQRRLSPWILLNSTKFKQFFVNRVSSEEAYPDAVRETPDFVSGFVLGLLQLIAFVVLLPKLQITSGSGAAMFGAVYSVLIWLIVDLQMVSVTNIVSYEYVLKDALLSAVMGAILGVVVSWSQRRFA